MAKAELRIDGMTCGHCVASVTRALEGTSGVSEARVAVGGAAVRYDERRIQPGDLVAAVAEAGYAAELVG